MQIPFVSAVRIEALQRPVDPEASYPSKPDRIFKARLKMTYLPSYLQNIYLYLVKIAVVFKIQA